ncbi:MAG: O-antigen ligase family protein [Verrucomicrobiales bacterium]|jgi:hypothetical protein|nr:O-antigen ligase family protein [Verrucomicrobiales bacterium]
MQQYFFNGTWRMDWGLGSPNITAAMIACLMVAVWGLAFVRRWGFWAALSCFTILGLCLVHTISRGGLVAIIVGSIPLVIYAPRPWERNKVVAIVFSILLMFTFSLYLGAQARYVQGVVQEDRSISNRLALWKYAPTMMVDAPGGWGHNKAIKSYMLWYRPLDKTEGYRNFVNAHLDWLVDYGWGGRAMYVFAWLTIFILCWPNVRARWLAIPCGIWLAHFTASFFSSVTESRWVWVLPCAAIAVALGYRIFRNTWPEQKRWLIPVIGSGLVLAVLWYWGQPGTHLYKTGDIVTIGKGAPKVWLVANSKVMGRSYGIAIRSKVVDKMKDPPAVAVVSSVENIPASATAGATLVLVGEFADIDKTRLVSMINAARKVILLNPTVYPQELDVKAEARSKIKVIAGEFSSSAALVGEWQHVAVVQVDEGAGEYLPNWDIILVKELVD